MFDWIRAKVPTYTLIPILILVMMLLDELLAKLHWQQAIDFLRAFSYGWDVVAINGLMAEVWFAQFIAFLLTPIVLIVVYRRTFAQVTPWIIVALVLLLSWAVQTHDGYTTHNHTYYSTAEDLGFAVHDGPRFFVTVNDDFGKDTLLESIAPNFILNEAVVVVISLCTFGLWRMLQEKET